MKWFTEESSHLEMPNQSSMVKSWYADIEKPVHYCGARVFLLRGDLTTCSSLWGKSSPADWSFEEPSSSVWHCRSILDPQTLIQEIFIKPQQNSFHPVIATLSCSPHLDCSWHSSWFMQTFFIASWVQVWALHLVRLLWKPTTEGCLIAQLLLITEPLTHNVLFLRQINFCF